MCLKLAEQHFAVGMSVVLLKPKVTTSAAKQVRRDFIQLDKFLHFSLENKSGGFILL